MFIEFRNTKKEKDRDEASEETNLTQTPQELLEYGYQKISRELSRDILELVKLFSPRFFEKLVIELVLKMGYGGSLKDAGKAIGKSGDGGIDGIIKEDKLGLDIVYIQAKKWEGIVGRPEVQKFVGALADKHANKGVFITTSDFTKEAREYAERITHKVVLIDGEMLAQLMIENDIGVSSVINCAVKEIDSDYFVEG